MNRCSVIVLLIAVSCGESSSPAGGRISVISHGQRIDVDKVAEKGKVTAVLFYAEW